METSTDVQIIPKIEDTGAKEGSYIEIELPYTLFRFLSKENCNVQNICRICLSTDNDVLFPLLAAKENSFLADMFMTLTAVRLLPEDGLPSSICESCQNLVVQYYEFKIKCEKSDCMLRSILRGEFITKEEPPDYSMPVEQTRVEDPIIDNSNTAGIEGEAGLLEEELCAENESQWNIFKPESNETEDNFVDDVDTNRKQTQKETRSLKCIYCSKVFVKERAFHLHVKAKHGVGGDQPYPCGQCKESFDSEHDLTVHSALHNKGTYWKCNQCQKEYNSRACLRRHVQRHMQRKAHACGTCGKTFSERYALRRHSRVHTGERLEKKHACHICDKRYSESSLLAAHMSRHIGLRPCECNTCGKRFPSKRLLTSHMLVHTDRKPYACQYCDKRFRHESTRNTHHRTHTGEKPYVCCACGKSFIQNSNLTLHMRTHTGERPYSCSMCDRKFTSGSSLKSHERIHTGERPYSCNICGKKFARRNLGAHMRQHTGERPFACSACPKKFGKASRLRDHCRIHTGEMPYECAYCTFTFATKSQLVKHMKSHEPEKKTRKRKLMFVQQVPVNPSVITDSNVHNQNDGQLMAATENTPVINEISNIEKDITLNIIQEVPLEVTEELILEDNSDVKTELEVDNSQNSYQISNNNVCLDAGAVNIINDEMNYESDVNLVTVNEGGVSISASTIEGTTVKLYQLDQSLVQIHSSGGQVTISKITSKMTANF